MPAKKTTDIVTIDDAVTSSQVLAYLNDPSSLPHIGVVKEDPDVVARRILGQTLDANSPEALFGEQTVLHGKDLVGKPYLFTDDITWLPSDIEGDGLPFYGVFVIANGNGERFPMTCGAKSVVTKLAKAHAEGWLPLWLKITKADSPTASGYYPLDIVAAEGPTEKGGAGF